MNSAARSIAERKLAWINAKLSAGRIVLLNGQTFTRADRCRFRVHANGLYVQSGTHWVDVTAWKAQAK